MLIIFIFLCPFECENLQRVQVSDDVGVVVAILRSSHGRGREEKQRKSLVVHCDGR